MHGSATRTFAPDLISDIHHYKVKGHQELLKGTSTAKAMIYWNASPRRTIMHAANKHTQPTLAKQPLPLLSIT